MIRNYMEDLVDQLLNELLDNNADYADVCRCECCMDDIKAKALNNIQPFYITGKTGEVYGEFFTREYQNSTNMVMEVVKAIECVRKNENPNHICVKR